MISARIQKFFISVLLITAVVAVFAPVAGYNFINIDDAEYVRENGNINHGFSLAAVKWAFENTVTGNWHPLTMLSHMLDCQVYGLNAGGHHFTNVLWHTANTVLLFLVLLAMTNQNPQTNETNGGKPRSNVGRNFWPCALVAALFGLHPLHVESVTWISERKDVLSGFFFMLTLGAYSRYVAKTKILTGQIPGQVGGSGRGLWYALALLFFALGLMSKPMLVTIPFVLLLLDYWPLGRFTGAKQLTEQTAVPVAAQPSSVGFLVLEKVPFLLLAAIFSALTCFTQKSAGAIVTLENLPLKERLAAAMASYAHYLSKTLWPESLGMPYPWVRWTDGQVEAATALFIGLTIIAVWAARRRGYLFVGWFLFVGMLVPVIGLVQVGQTVMADHYTYLPLIGIFIALAWGLADFAVSPVRRKLAASGAVLAVSFIAFTAAVQVHYWKDSKTLFTHAIDVTGSNPVAQYILGALCDSEGKTDEAKAHFTAAVRDNPANVKARYALGYILSGEGNFDEAAVQYEAALRIAPNMAKAHFGLAEAMMKQHNFDGAMEHYTLALKSDPNIARAHYQLAALYSLKQDMSSTIQHLQEALRLDPDFVLALNNLGWIRATQADPKMRDGSEATRLAKRAVSLTGGNNPNTLDTLAAAYAESGKFEDAVGAAQSAIQMASATGQTNLVSEIGSRLKLYQSQQAYRE